MKQITITSLDINMTFHHGLPFMTTGKVPATEVRRARVP